MGWHAGAVVLLVCQYLSPSAGVPYAFTLPHSFIESDIIPFEADNVDNDDRVPTMDEYEDSRLVNLESMLTSVLLEPWPRGVSPLLYVENSHSESIVPNESISYEDEPDISSPRSKKARYYRKYPWKRYDAENRYLCTPSKDDVFRLLVALHEARQGNRAGTVNFCNRKRPAAQVFTNIRFLG